MLEWECLDGRIVRIIFTDAGDLEPTPEYVDESLILLYPIVGNFKLVPLIRAMERYKPEVRLLMAPANPMEVNRLQKLISMGLKLLASAYEVLKAVSSLSVALIWPPPSPTTLYHPISIEALNIKSRLLVFLHSLHHHGACYRPKNFLIIFHGILIEFLIRCTLRCILRYSQPSLRALGQQASQDLSFDDGTSCILNEPMVQFREKTFRELKQEEIATRAELVKAALLIGIPDPWDKTPMDHIQYFFRAILSKQRGQFQDIVR